MHGSIFCFLKNTAWEVVTTPVYTDCAWYASPKNSLQTTQRQRYKNSFQTYQTLLWFRSILEMLEFVHFLHCSRKNREKHIKANFSNHKLRYHIFCMVSEVFFFIKSSHPVFGWNTMAYLSILFTRDTLGEQYKR